MSGEDMCLTDSATTHTILRDKIYFTSLTLEEAYVNTISSTANLIEGSKRVNIMLPGGTKLYISNALYSSKYRRNLLSFKDICRNGYHIETTNEFNIRYLCITYVISC